MSCVYSSLIATVRVCTDKVCGRSDRQHVLSAPFTVARRVHRWSMLPESASVCAPHATLRLQRCGKCVPKGDSRDCHCSLRKNRQQCHPQHVLRHILEWVVTSSRTGTCFTCRWELPSPEVTVMLAHTGCPGRVDCTPQRALVARQTVGLHRRRSIALGDIGAVLRIAPVGAPDSPAMRLQKHCGAVHSVPAPAHHRRMWPNLHSFCGAAPVRRLPTTEHVTTS